MTPLNTEERFWSLVERVPWTTCWLWMGGDEDYGYGRYCFNGKRRRAHALAFEFSTGIKTNGKCVCHKCDVRTCVNPDHLFLGTRADNLRDMWAKGRGVNNPKLGEKHGMAKLKELQVLEIRARLKTRESQSSIAKSYGVSQSQISLIKLRKEWSHLN